MSKAALDNLLQDLHRIAGIDALRDHADAELLARFTAQRDEPAFATLVWRHGGLVFGVCKRMLSSEQDAEDAFQATFLTLARKAETISRKESLAAWLYRVAYRIALRVRKKTPIHDAALLNELPARDAGNDPEKREILQSLDEEIAQLPTSSARAIVLCYFEGKTHDEAALLLGCPKGTLASWIARARQHLHDRLTRRGCALSAAGLATLLAEQASAAPAAWTPPTAKAAVAFVSGGVLSTNAVVLSEGILRMMWLNKLKMFTAIALMLVTFGLGAGFLANAVWGSGLDAPAANDAAPFQGDAQAEIAKLRDEIAKLRAELKDAVKEIKNLKDALPDKEASATYRGKPTSFWLEQYKDADSRFRAEAVEALGVLVLRNKKLIPVLIDSLQETTGDGVAEKAILAVAKQGPDALPSLIEIAKDKTQDHPKSMRQNAIQAIGLMKSNAKPAVPVLAKALNETRDRGTCAATVRALHFIGPDAKEAIPALVELLDRCVRDIGKNKGEYAFGETSSFEIGQVGGINVIVLNALERIEPSILNNISTHRELGIISPAGPFGGKGGKGGPPSPNRAKEEGMEAEMHLRKTVDVLKAKYLPQK